MLHLQLLGGLGIRNARTIAGAGGQRKALVLLAVVAAAPNGGITREKLIGYFWPDATEERARNALRQRVFALRRDLGEEPFVGTSELRLNPASFTVDLWEFDAAIARGDLERAASLHAGPFLDGVYVNDAPELERYIEEKRAEIAARAAAVLTTLATGADERGDAPAAVRWWRQLAQLDPTASRPAHGLIAALIATGDASAALAHYRVHEALLREQLEMEPTPSLRALADEIAGGTFASNVPAPSARPAAHLADADPSHAARASAPESARESATEGAPVVRLVHEANVMPTVGERAAGPRRPGVRRRMLAALVAAGTVVAAIAWWSTDRTGDTDVMPRVLVTEFRDPSGDTSLAGEMRLAAQAVSDNLVRQGVAHVIDPASTLPRSDRQPTAVEDARRLGATQIIGATIARRGDSVFAQATITDPATGAIAQATTPMGAPRESTSVLVDRLSRKVTGTVSALNDPAFLMMAGAGAELPSIDALREFQKGAERVSRNQWHKALAHFREALRLDSSFVQAALWTMEGAGKAEYDALVAVIEARKDRLMPRDRAHFEYRTAWGRRDLETAYHAARELARLVPTSWVALNLLGGVATQTRRYDVAMDVFRRMNLRADGMRAWIELYKNAAAAFHHGSAHEDEERVLEEGAQFFPRDVSFCFAYGRALIALGKLREVSRQADVCARVEATGYESGLRFYYFNMAPELRAHGHPALADSFANAALAIALRLHVPSDPPGFIAEHFYQAGRHREAAPLFASDVRARPAEQNAMSLSHAGVSAAKAGDSAAVAGYRALIDAFNPARANAKLLALARIAAAERNEAMARRILEQFSRSGGLVHDHLHHDVVFEAYWRRAWWKALFAPRPS